MATTALIGLGSNLGDRGASLDAAVAELAGTPGVAVLAVSPYHETEPVGGPGGQSRFLNAAATLETSLDPHALLSALQAIEHRAGRVRELRWGARPLDLDLLLFGDRVMGRPPSGPYVGGPPVALTVPHPSLPFRRFVLAPTAEIAPDLVDPITRRTITSLLANLDRRPGCVAVGEPSPERRTRLLQALAAALSAEGPRGDGWRVADLRLDEPAPHREAVEPTFLVIPRPVPDDLGARLDDWGVDEGTPILVPASTEPDGIVAEVVTACAASRAGRDLPGAEAVAGGPSPL